MTLHSTQVEIASGLDSHRPLGNRLLDALKDGGKTLREVADLLGLADKQLDSLRVTATRLQKRGLVIKLGDDQWGVTMPGGGLPHMEPEDPMSKDVPW